jgi:hypothetical protein
LAGASSAFFFDVAHLLYPEISGAIRKKRPRAAGMTMGL